MFILFPEVAGDMSTLGKDEVAHTSSKYDGEEEPAIVGHSHQHEEVAIADLHHMQDRLQHMRAHTDGVVLDTEVERWEGRERGREGVIASSLSLVMQGICGAPTPEWPACLSGSGHARVGDLVLVTSKMHLDITMEH